MSSSFCSRHITILLPVLYVTSLFILPAAHSITGGTGVSALRVAGMPMSSFRSSINNALRRIQNLNSEMVQSMTKNIKFPFQVIIYKN